MDWREQTARADVKRWAQCVRRDADEFVAVASHLPFSSYPPSEAEQVMNIRVAHAADRIWGDTAHWYKATSSDGFPSDLRQEIQQVLDPEVREVVRHLRNITEHWDENRRYFEDPTLPVPRRLRSVRWYMERESVNPPWSWGWTAGRGYALGPGLQLDRLLAEIQKVEVVLTSQAVNSSYGR